MQKAANTTAADPGGDSASMRGGQSAAPEPVKAPTPEEIRDAFLGTGLPEPQPGLDDDAEPVSEKDADTASPEGDEPEGETDDAPAEEVIDMTGGKPADDEPAAGADDKGGRVPQWADALPDETKAELRKYRDAFLSDLRKAREKRDAMRADLEAAQAELSAAKTRLESGGAGRAPVPWDPLSDVGTEAELAERMQAVDRNIDWALQNIDGYEHKDEKTGETTFVEPEKVRAFLKQQQAVKSHEAPTRERLRKAGENLETVKARYPREMLDDPARATAFKAILDEDPVITRHPRHQLMVHDTITMDMVRAGKFKLVRSAPMRAAEPRAKAAAPVPRRGAPLSASAAEPPVKPVRQGAVDVPALRAAAEKGDKRAQAKLQELIVFGSAA